MSEPSMGLHVSSAAGSKVKKTEGKKEKGTSRKRKQGSPDRDGQAKQRDKKTIGIREGVRRKLFRGVSGTTYIMRACRLQNLHTHERCNCHTVFNRSFKK